MLPGLYGFFFCCPMGIYGAQIFMFCGTREIGGIRGKGLHCRLHMGWSMMCHGFYAVTVSDM